MSSFYRGLFYSAFSILEVSPIFILGSCTFTLKFFSLIFMIILLITRVLFAECYPQLFL